jgi:hypothetical protein
MIRLDELHEDQLAQLNLRWVPLTELYDEDDLDDDVDNDNLSVLCYAGQYSVDPIVIFELERLLNEGASKDRMILVLHEFASDCNGERWFEGEWDDLHEWGHLRVGDGYDLGEY